MMARQSPQWAKPNRQAYLASLLTNYLAERGWQFDLLTGEFYHPQYDARIKPIIANWREDDRADAITLWGIEQKAIHGLGEHSYPLRGEFSTVAKDIYYARQPQYYFIGLGISVLNFKPFAKVRLASSFIALHVNLGDALKEVSKNKRRKAIRYGKPLPRDIQERVDLLCRQAVKHYLA
jgi:hypothetical protein